jgi:hypothetical protein
MVLKNSSSPCEYELMYITWSGIEYDRDKLIQFVQRYKDISKAKKQPELTSELIILDSILEKHNIANLQKLLDNEPQYTRWAIIERFARKATTELMLEGKYTKETFDIISNLPLKDYKLIVKRAKELVKTITETTAEVETDMSVIPGVK